MPGDLVGIRQATHTLSSPIATVFSVGTKGDRRCRLVPVCHMALRKGLIHPIKCTSVWVPSDHLTILCHSVKTVPVAAVVHFMQHHFKSEFSVCVPTMLSA